MTYKHLCLACLALGLLGGSARADSLASLPEPTYALPAANPQQEPIAGTIRSLLYPTIGCPSVVAPGEDLTPIVHLADGGASRDWRARLESARDLFVQTIPLPLATFTFDGALSIYRLSFTLPAGVPEDTYDLVIECPALPGRTDTQPNAVRVLRPRADFEVAHVADTQIRDPQTRLPQKFEQLLAELKLRDPALTLYSGDLNFGLDYAREYAENWEILHRGALAMACAPGNHDGYAWLTGPTTVSTDGLHNWRRTIGPTYFAMRLGGMRLIAANSYGGPSERRNGYTFLVHNSGGDIEPSQLAWIEGQAVAAGAAGEEAVLFLHHNPHPQNGLTPNVPGYPWSPSLVGAASNTWNGAASRDALTAILGRYPAMRWVLAGHTNNDYHRIERLGSGAAAHDVHYVNTTSPCNGGHPQEGYRMLSIRGGRIAEVDYQSAQPSVPFPLGGNLAATYLDPNDGTASVERVRVDNLLERPVEVTLKLFMRADLRGYGTSAGFIREVGIADAGPYVVYLRLTAPARGAVEATVAPAPAGGGALPAVLGGTPGSGSGSVASSGGSGGGCSASLDPRASSSRAAVTWALLAAGLLGAIVVRWGRRGVV